MENKVNLREKQKVFYTEDSIVDELKWTKLLETKRFTEDTFERVLGSEVTAEWASNRNFLSPVVVQEPKGLGMKMPPSNLSVNDVANLCGPDRIIDVIQVSTQSDQQMTLQEWADYFNQSEYNRGRILNVIR